MSCTYMSQTIEQNEIKFVIVDFQGNLLTATHLMMTKIHCCSMLTKFIHVHAKHLYHFFIL